MRDGLPIILALFLAGLASCATPPGGFDSPEPAAHLYAITAAARDDDRSAIPALVSSLDSDDPVVRMFSIRTLEKMTGQTLGYDHAAPEWEQPGPPLTDG